MLAVKPHTHCRVCSQPLGEPYLDLGCQPFANGLIGPAFNPQHETSAPLQIILCRYCGLSQLSVVVDPSVLYSGYRFRSGASSGWVAHCEALAEKATSMWKQPGLVVDIAANDGTQLKPFHDRGWTCIGVEPAEIHSDYSTYRALWSMDVAKRIRDVRGPADLVIAQNVFGHVDDCIGFLKAAEYVLAPDGMLAIEVPHVRDMLINVEFDTIYHEHLSYWSTGALIKAGKQANLALHKIDHLGDIHGGSKRYWLKKGAETAELHPILTEIRVDDRAYKQFATAVERRLQQVIRELKYLEQAGRKVYAYGASAKGAVMLNALKARGNEVWPEFIADDVKEKQGFLSPGIHLPIVDPSELQYTGSADVCWVLSWNWSQQLKQRARDNGFRGEFFLASPTVRLES